MMVSASSSELRLPSLRLHKASGRRVVTIPGGGPDVYLGEFGTPECERNYRRLCADLLTHG